MMRSSSASYALMSDSLLLELVSDNRRRGGETDMTEMMVGVKAESPSSECPRVRETASASINENVVEGRKIGPTSAAHLRHTVNPACDSEFGWTP